MKKLNIALLGYGKMGREIEQLFPSHCQISLIIDNEKDWELNGGKLEKMDVAIEFSQPDTAYTNCKRCLAAGVPIVSGTTGWDEQRKELLKLKYLQSPSFVYGSNFSIGANLFFSVNQYLADLMNRQKQYNVSVSEIHHTAKKDKPSGTAVTLAELILHEIDRKKGWELDAEKEDIISVYADREEDITGIHEVCYYSEEDRMLLRHQANNRRGFAMGAIKAAQWLVENPGIYNFKDIYHLI